MLGSSEGIITPENVNKISERTSVLLLILLTFSNAATDMDL